MNSSDFGSISDSAPTRDLRDEIHNSPTRHRFEALDNYRIEAELGRGGMGEVYLATEQPLNRQVALKVLPGAGRISSTQVKRFLLEAQAVAQLSHDHIVPIYHVGNCNGTYYFAMRYIQGMDLAQIIRSGQKALQAESHPSIETQVSIVPQGNTPLVKPNDSTVKDKADSTVGRIDLSAKSLARSKRGTAHKLAVSVALVGQTVAEALHHAHQHGIVHRDIKPSNLMLDQSNKVWVTDFGLAQLQGSPALTQTGDVVGTLRYMSPEQASARRAFIDHRTDIYSLGVTLYELATLQKACPGERAQDILRALTFERPIPIRKINPKLPHDLETIICKATERNPSDRYQTAAEMAADLQRFANSESLIARRPGKLKIIRNWVSDRPTVAVMALAMLIMSTLLASITALYLYGQEAAEWQRANAAQAALKTSEGQQLQTVAYLMRDRDPGLGIAAGIAGAESAPSSFADLALMSSVDRNHELKTLAVRFDYPGECVVADDGSKVVLCKNRMAGQFTKQNAQVWDLRNGSLIATLKNSEPITAATFVDSDRVLITASSSPDPEGKQSPTKMRIQIWNTQSLASISEQTVDHEVRIGKSNFSAARRQIVIPNNDRSATIFDVPGFTEAMVIPSTHGAQVVECIFSPDGSKIATLALDNQTIVWDSQSGNEMWRFQYPNPQAINTHIYFTADSKQLCVSGDSGSTFLKDGKQVGRQTEKIFQVSQYSNLVLLEGATKKSIVVYNTEYHSVGAQCSTEELVFQATLFQNDQLLAGMLDEELVVFDSRTGQKLSRLIGHRDRITALSPIPNSPELVSLSWDGTLRHWHAHSDLTRRTFTTKQEADSPALLSLSVDKSKLLIGTVKTTPTDLYTLGHDDAAPLRFQGHKPIFISNDRIFTCIKDNVALWDSKTRRKLLAVPLPGNASQFPSKILELLDRQRIAIQTQEGELYFWNLISNQVARFAPQNTERVKAIALDPTGRQLFLSLSTSELISLSMDDLQRQHVATLPCPARRLEFARDGKSLLVSGNNRTAFTFNLADSQIGSTFSSPDSPITAAWFLTSDRIVTHGGLSTKRVILWDAKTGQELDSLATGALHELTVDQEQQTIAIASTSEATYWNLVANEKIRIETKPCDSIAFVKDKIVLTTSEAAAESDSNSLVRQLVTWDPTQRKVVASRPLTNRVLEIVSQPGNDNFLVSTSTYGVECLEVATALPIQDLAGHNEPLMNASFGLNDDSVFTVSADGVVLEHAVLSGKKTILGVHNSKFLSATFSRDKKVLLTTDTTGLVQIWDLLARKVTRELRTDSKSSDLAVIAHNNSFVAIRSDATVIIWNLLTDVKNDVKFEDDIRQIAFSPDGRLLAITTGKMPIYPGPSGFDLNVTPSKDRHDAFLISTTVQSRERLPVTASVVGCQFVGNGDKVAVLTTEGVVRVFKTLSRQQQFAIEPGDRVLQILEMPGESSLIATTAKNGFSFWDAESGAIKNEVIVRMSMVTATRSLPQSLLLNATTDYRILSNDGQYYKHPISVLNYAKKVAPRRLDAKERRVLLSAPLN